MKPGIKIFDRFYLIWTIASKDIIDALKNRLVVSLIASQIFMLSIPKVLPLVLVPPGTGLLIYDRSNSNFSTTLEQDPQFTLRKVGSMQELEEVLYNSMTYKLGLVVPPDYDQNLETGGGPEIEAYVSWSNRGRIREWKQEYEEHFSESLGVPVTVKIQDNYIYPQPELGLGLGITALTAITVTLLVGINLVPTLMIEEKQTRTLEALLVSPASIGQVVIGKAIAGLFYMLVAASIVFAINLKGVVHWKVAVLFSLSIGIFAVAVGLVLGSIFNRQQDMTGWSMGVTVILLGAMFVDMLNVQVHNLVKAIIPWVPSVSLLDVFRSVFLESPNWENIWRGLGSVLVISMILYGVVVWLVRRMDR